MTPAGGDPPASPVPEPRTGPEPASGRGTQSVVAALLIVFGVLGMVACIVGASVFALTRGANASAASSPRKAPSPMPLAGHSVAGSEPPEIPDVAEPPLASPPAESKNGIPPEDEAAPLSLTSHDAVWGEPAAAVTIVSFLDLECEYSRQLLPDLVRLKSEFGADLRWVYKHRPLAENELAVQAARTFARAHHLYGNGGFFRLIVEAAHSEELLSRPALEAWLQRSGLGSVQIADSAGDGVAVADVSVDVDLAARFGVRSTPTLFVNGLRLEGVRPLGELRSAVTRELATARWLRASGMPVSQIYLRRSEQTLLGIGEEAPSRECVPLEGSPAQGPESALVTIVQFSDFECTFCKQSAPVIKALLPRFKDQLKMVWKSFPLPQHTYARSAANFALEARELAGDRGFWLVHELLLAEKGELDEGKLAEIARHAGLPEQPLLDAARSGEHDAALLADVKLGRRLDVEGVPTFFVNGRRVSGVASRRSFDALVLEELASARKIATASREAETIYQLLCTR